MSKKYKFTCAHISDIHWRGLSRHNEYKESFKDFFKTLKKLKPDVIFIGGDIVHSKTQGISPELIESLTWWFSKMADISDVHVILGNHDGLILNKHRQDAITPILAAMNDKRIHLYKNSGVYDAGIDGFNWCVFSCFDEKGWKNVKPVKGAINIAAYHGSVVGSLTDTNWELDGELKASFFNDYDFTFLGDIHKFQYLDEKETIAYPGSSIQQNYGEDTGKGFLYWQINDAEDYKSTFIEIAHANPFITIDWAGNVKDTLEDAEEFPNGSRFRIRSSVEIPQAEIKHLYAALKENKNATEIVCKFDHNGDSNKIQAFNNELFKEDLRDPSIMKKLFNQYYEDSNVTDDQWQEIDSIIGRYLSTITGEEEVTRNVKWSIRDLEFDNTFAYGKNNRINFDSLSGITGLFGKNRIGKSSIPGTLMYGLYNTTDRGAMKNLYVINSRKGHCVTKVKIAVNGKYYLIERQSTKKQTRVGDLRAVTHLNLFEVDSEGNKIRDLSGEQRRDSDKKLRQLIGLPEDFLMTSLASQGDMNHFIKEKATRRKAILTNFLDLNIFDHLQDISKAESAEIKALLKNTPERDWDALIAEKRINYRDNLRERNVLEGTISKKRNKKKDLEILLATHKDKDSITQSELDNKLSELKNLNLTISNTKNEITETNDYLIQLEDKLEKICTIKEQFPIEALKEDIKTKSNVEKKLVELSHTLERERTLLSNQKKSIKILEDVPCGDSFPNCKFIKNSHCNSKKVESQRGIVDNFLKEFRSTKRSLKKFEDDDLESKIKKYDEILQKENEYKLIESKNNASLELSKNKLEKLEEQLHSLEVLIADMKLRVSNDDSAKELSKLKTQINTLEEEIENHDAHRMNLSESIGLLSSSIEKLGHEKEEYQKLLAKWKIYELITGAVSKNGLPLRIISAQLPVINAEIAKILQDVVGFTVELESDEGSNAMDIFLNYGDSRRIIECGSGMEKMMASLAIRVALINVSSLPKTDLLIIDEGFGALDETNVEACNRLLESLKRWFRNILVISHVDAVKDAVDNVLDITKHRRDAHVRVD